ncbi:MAG: hypothetical protein AB1792_05445 [Candidatus Zixiibacteriota bacterium]
MSRTIARWAAPALCGLVLLLSITQTSAENVDPTDRIGIGLRMQGGWTRNWSKGVLEIDPGFQEYDQVSFSHPLGFRDFVIRYYATRELDYELGINVHSQDVYTWRIWDVPLSVGAFQRSSLDDNAHVRFGGRLNADIVHCDCDPIYWGGTMQDPGIDDGTHLTFSLEPAASIEWFIDKHFSLTPEVFLNLELPNDNTNDGHTSLHTGFHLMITVLQ